ncbi:MAG: enoyl-CoA hydratase/isomerase family protein [Chloroflexi bacterium]|nr:enoyl-CoA hydratase/isomerase family protein [Chloroflexota bacterium]
MPYETIKYETVEEHIVLLTLNRPEKLNALNRALFEELDDAVQKIERDQDVLVYMVTGAPRTDGRPMFTAGADLKPPAGMGPTPHWLANDVINQIDTMRTPSIAVIDGFCTTGGMELILACDLRIASSTAQFCDWHLKNTGAGIGGWGAATRLSRTVGLSKAKEMLLTGMIVDGEEARRIGLVNRTFSSERLMDGALEVARSIAGMRPDGIRLTMGFLEMQMDMDLHQALRWADVAPSYMGIKRRFDDMTERFEQRGEQS